jgi:hypothetical protein
MKKIFALLLIVVFLVACNLPIGTSPEATPETIVVVVTTTPETPSGEETLPPAPTEPPAPLGNTITQDGITMTIPDCLVLSTSVTREAALLPEENPGPGDIWPAHRAIRFSGYPLSGTFFEPLVRIFPLESYPVVDTIPASQISELNQLLIDQPFVVDHTIPFLPIFHAGQAFRLKIDYLSFLNGQGVRFLTEYAQYMVPMNNHDLFYTFQGMTADGRYWISAIFPINNAVLPSSADDTIVPPGGLAIPDWNSPTFDTDFAAYYDQLGMILNGLPDESFTPSITCLDAFVQSLQVGD